VVRAKMPESEIGDLIIEVRSATAGVGSFTFKFDHMAELTGKTADQIYNNFYEFGSSKNIAKAAQALKIRPWTIKIDGMVEKPHEIGIDDLIRKMPLEERSTAIRCVEAWSMTMPWTGLPDEASWSSSRSRSARRSTSAWRPSRPDHRARPAAVLVSVALCRGPDHRRGDQRTRLPGHRRLRQAAAQADGRAAPARVPWKYGFKSIKSIVRFTFTEERPKSFWEEIQGAEYGFWANVNPEVPHPRWSQATERD
jgi:methionine sulfoxide reductase catalytic subunit